MVIHWTVQAVQDTAQPYKGMAPQCCHSRRAKESPLKHLYIPLFHWTLQILFIREYHLDNAYVTDPLCQQEGKVSSNTATS